MSLAASGGLGPGSEYVERMSLTGGEGVGRGGEGVAGYSLPVQRVKTANTYTHISVRESLPWCPTQSGLGAMGSGAGGPPYFGLYLPPLPFKPRPLAHERIYPCVQRAVMEEELLFFWGGGGGGTLTVW